MQDEIAADNLNGLKSLDFQIQKWSMHVSTNAMILSLHFW